ncbi:uncharacterized protein Z520_09737 [Fonsecaea multimorphosa CBS 102226]|uniref:Uncharacterized protein n=1 Tax=Fonsecaea multimorphosa CBS 102226 TaxID=1442371 RepID=A0A0D2IC20_9EURO|nr:uncharacterized protein Z520_09737 [Fonsecaea multimorphosa CBS 102226]KIX94691.1 hypothetical protein Z520_09737 [Fonsecaea multimorphosa CBS 102226]OAL18793.1 hypothetical protein AYO22_10122 [Fonsecaea multimorphosa]
MGTGKRPGDDIAIPVASKIQRSSTDAASNILTQPDQDIPVINRQLPDPPFRPLTEFHLKIRICSEKKAVRNDPKHPANGDEETSNVEYLDSKIAEYDEFSHLPWLEPMEVVMTRGDSSLDGRAEIVGFCGAKLIRRTKIRRKFYRQMSKTFDEPTLLAFDLFDRFGNLKDDYEDHAIRKGLPMWEPRLDQGDILLIEDIIIEKPYRRLGLAKKIVTALLETTKRKTKGGFAVILWPESSKDVHFQDLLTAIVGDSGNVHRPEVFDHHDSVAIAWARSLGFRRIGSSIWFGLACWRGLYIPDGDDYDPPVFKRAVQDTLPESIRAESSDRMFLKAAQQYVQQIKPDSQQWFAIDKEANTLLHLAALNSLPESVAWIMQQPASAQLMGMRNSSGNTPLEALLQKLEIVRTRSWSGTSITIVSDDFEGHTVASAKCIALLKQVKIDTEEDLEQFRYGCTCGECIDGYLSPRMRFALSLRADMLYHRLQEDMDNLSGDIWVSANESALEHLPDYCLKLLSRYRASREGCIRLCCHITDCLDVCSPPDKASIGVHVDAEKDNPICIDKFFKCGGNIEGIMFHIFEEALGDDEIFGDGFLHELDEDCLWYEEEKCRNDHEFVLVARKCGYGDMAKALKFSLRGILHHASQNDKGTKSSS